MEVQHARVFQILYWSPTSDLERDERNRARPLPGLHYVTHSPSRGDSCAPPRDDFPSTPKAKLQAYSHKDSECAPASLEW